MLARRGVRRACLHGLSVCLRLVDAQIPASAGPEARSPRHLAPTARLDCTRVDVAACDPVERRLVGARRRHPAEEPAIAIPPGQEPAHGVIPGVRVWLVVGPAGATQVVETRRAAVAAHHHIREVDRTVARSAARPSPARPEPRLAFAPVDVVDLPSVEAHRRSHVVGHRPHRELGPASWAGRGGQTVHDDSLETIFELIEPAEAPALPDQCDQPRCGASATSPPCSGRGCTASGHPRGRRCAWICRAT